MKKNLLAKKDSKPCTKIKTDTNIKTKIGTKNKVVTNSESNCSFKTFNPCALSHPQIPTSPVNVDTKDISELLRGMTRTGFQGKKLGQAFEVWEKMLKEDDITIFLGISGAMVPAGMRNVFIYLIRNRLVDVVVSTGANIFHDIHEAIGFKHYIGSEKTNDSELYEKGIDRIYDVFAFEDEFNKIDYLLSDISSEIGGTCRIPSSYSGLSPYLLSSREFLNEIAKRVRVISTTDSFLIAAYESGVPVFCPSIADSSIGIALAITDNPPPIDTIKDVRELTEIDKKSQKTGVIYIGGGVPKNFIQQTEVVTRLSGVEKGGHDYAIQFTTDSPQWGGLSGCTFEEGVSWGKIRSSAGKIQVNVDATIALPIIAQGLTASNRERIPVFKWNNKNILELNWEKFRKSGINTGKVSKKTPNPIKTLM